MSPEYQKIVDHFVVSENYSTNATKFVVGKCEQLAKEKHAALEKRIVELSRELAEHKRNSSKPVRQLTDDECQKIWNEVSRETAPRNLVTKVIEMYIAKQNEPNEIPFDQSKLNEGGWNVKVYSEHGIKDCFYSAHRVVLVRK